MSPHLRRDDSDTDEIEDDDEEDEVPKRRRNSAFKRAVRKITLARVFML